MREISCFILFFFFVCALFFFYYKRVMGLGIRISQFSIGPCLERGFEALKFTRFMVGDGERIQFWEDLWWGDQPLGVHYPRLLRVVTDKNIPISSILGSTRPFSWNFNFRRNLSDSEIEDLESLMRSLDLLHLSPLVLDMRVFISFKSFHSQIFFSCLIPIFWFAFSFPYQVSLEFSSPFQNQVLCLVSGSQEGKY